MRITAGMAAICPALIFSLALAASGSEEDSDPGTGTDNTTKPYVKPDTAGLHWVETFDGDVWSRWAHSDSEKYTGRFEVQQRKKEALVGDLGFTVPDEAKHYGAAVSFAPLEGKKDTPFIVQFEAKFQDGLTCGGSYMKLFDSGGRKASEFRDDTPYVIMFGPDRCGGTDKVHFILRHRSPKTGKFEEKHCKDAPATPHDQLTHLYRLIINPDNSFEIQIDGERKASGSLLSSMEPPVNPPKEIDDPADSKPADWADEAKMDDPAASKPEDWDEDAPAQIPDPKASMPSGWREDAPARIADPEAMLPQDWDEEEDGEWEAPLVENPACKVGCGRWEAPRIGNPAYKGRWHAPKIDNPAFKGAWKPRQIANPDYFVDEAPCVLPKIDAVGFDLWTMSKGLMFDNLVIATELAKAKAFAEESWVLRHQIEKLQEPKSTGSQGGWWEILSKNLVAVAVTCGVLITSALWFCCMRKGAVQPRPSATARKASEKKEKTRSREASAEEEKEGEQEKDKNEGGAKEEEEEEERKAPEPATETKPAVEGGLGDISGGN
mmetsp:Transcript_91042/g.266575  ORF Transcript_91042/g.266575 Transcript_91042/m.266575 type:complete len:550 (-) Transcript_91042:205-1854(-)